jgi:hypothetical protein
MVSVKYIKVAEMSLRNFRTVGVGGNLGSCPEVNTDMKYYPRSVFSLSPSTKQEGYVMINKEN